MKHQARWWQAAMMWMTTTSPCAKVAAQTRPQAGCRAGARRAKVFAHTTDGQPRSRGASLEPLAGSRVGGHDRLRACLFHSLTPLFTCGCAVTDKGVQCATSASLPPSCSRAAATWRGPQHPSPAAPTPSTTSGSDENIAGGRIRVEIKRARVPNRSEVGTPAARGRDLQAMAEPRRGRVVRR